MPPPPASLLKRSEKKRRIVLDALNIERVRLRLVRRRCHGGRDPCLGRLQVRAHLERALGELIRQPAGRRAPALAVEVPNVLARSPFSTELFDIWATD